MTEGVGAMRNAIFCKSCGNLIATADNMEIKIQHRGRIIRVYGSAAIQCEKCGRENQIAQEDLRRPCGDNTTVSDGTSGHAQHI